MLWRTAPTGAVFTFHHHIEVIMAYAEKRGRGPTPWRVRYQLPDGRYESASGFETKNLALKHGRAMETDVSRHSYFDPESAMTPVGEWAREWMKAKQPRGRTIAKRWQLLETHILPKWQDTGLIRVNWFEAEAWANSIALTHDDVTAGHALTLLTMIMTGAVDAGRIPGNPLSGRRRSRTAAVKEKNQAKDLAKAASIRAAPPELVLQLARRLGPEDGLHILATAFAGLRWGEGLALTRDSVGERREPHWGGEWTCPVLQVRKEVAEYVPRDPATGEKLPMVFQLEPVKTDGSVRDIDLPPFLAAMIKSHVERMPDEHTYLFCTRSGSWWRRGNWGKVLRPAVNGRDARDAVRGHPALPAWDPLIPRWNMDLARHTHDSYQSEIGVADPLAHEQTGHRRQGIKGFYQHPTVPMRIERLDGLQAIYERGMKNLRWETVWEMPKQVSQISPKRSSTRRRSARKGRSAA